MEATLTQKPQPSSFLRWSALLLISLAMLGNYYIYDSISPLADLLKSQLGFSDSNIGLLNAIYSFPNILMVLVGGLIIDRIGTRISVVIFTFLITLGAVITAVTGNIYIMATGRLVFGLGAESMIVAITTIIARWFKGKELSFAFGLNLTVARLGSFLALNSPSWGKSLYEYWQSPLWVTVAGGVFALVAIIIYYGLDLYAVKNYEMPKDGEQDKIVFKEIFKFGKSFWFITALCVTFYSAMFPFQTFAIKFFQEAHGTTREVGGNLSSILTLAAMIFTPLFGLLSDKIGKRSLLMMFGSLLIIPVYLMMAY
ncbi:MAG TPA: MFS transporter, partial [Ignavibacteriaceae bacterium]|nr:MFS transporter [Ignavibacteriaceae bacterium]